MHAKAASEPAARGSLVALTIAFFLAGCSAAPAADAPSGDAVPASTEPSVEESQQPGRFIVVEAGPLPTSADDLRTETEVPFTRTTQCGRSDCVVPLDILAPQEGESLPTFVLVPGGPMPFQDRRYLADLASALAHEGAVVFLTSYRHRPSLNTEIDALDDVECAVRYAETSAAKYGGDPGRVILVGHSLGSYLGLQSLLSPLREPAHCLGEGDGRPDAIVAIAGFLGLHSPTTPDVAPVVTLVSGSEDSAAGEAPIAERMLAEGGIESTYVELEGIDHGEVIDPQAAPEIVPLLMEVAAGL